VIDAGRIFLTGGEGRLGAELRRLLPAPRGEPGIVAPTLAEMDITRPEQIEAALAGRDVRVLVHAAAYTNVAAAESDRLACWQINVEGTHNIVRAAMRHDLRLVHISTDYVFAGTAGDYREDDPPGPVRNYYALTKLVAEQLARLARRHLIIRTSFRPREWPYDNAFTDVYTSQDYVDVIAPEIALAIGHCDEIPYTVLHIATERKSLYELARRRRGDVRPSSKAESTVNHPDDTSLDVSRWRQLKQAWEKG